MKSIQNLSSFLPSSTSTPKVKRKSVSASIILTRSMCKDKSINDCLNSKSKNANKSNRKLKGKNSKINNESKNVIITRSKSKGIITRSMVKPKALKLENARSKFKLNKIRKLNTTVYLNDNQQANLEQGPKRKQLPFPVELFGQRFDYNYLEPIMKPHCVIQ